MNNIKELTYTQNGRIAIIVLGIALLLLLVKAAAPETINLIVSNGNECTITLGKSKKIKKGKKDNKKKNKKN